MQGELDAYDRRILALLQEDASLSSAQIAEKVGLSQSPCWRRIQRMKEEGIIRGQVTLLDRKKVGRIVSAVSAFAATLAPLPVLEPVMP